MSDLAIGGAGFGALFLLIALRVPIGVAMIVVGMIGYVSIAGTVPLLSFLKTELYWRFSSFDFSVIPLFLMMGNFANRAGVTQALFRAASAFIGHFRGGLAMAAIGGCAAFGTISGSSLATAAMMGQVSLPELRRYKYRASFATGCLAAGGTLGALIPPSIPLIIYAIMVEGNIVQLFQAAFIPGILAAIGYMIVIAIVVRIDPTAGPAAPRTNRKEKLLALRDVWTVLLVFVVVMGGIYTGAFTPTEGAGIGAVGMFLIAVFYGGMRMQGFIETMYETAMTSAMIFVILLGAGVLNAFLGFSQLPIWVADYFQNSGLPPYLIVIGMIILYLFLGCIMDFAGHDPDHDPDLLAHYRRARLRHGRRGREAVVRHHHADGGGDRADHPAGRAERVRDQLARQRRADDRHFPRRVAVPAFGHDPADAGRRLPGDVPDPAEADELAAAHASSKA